MSNCQIQPCTPANFEEWLGIAYESYYSTYDFVWEDGGDLYLQKNFNRKILEKAYQAGAYIGLCLLEEKPLGIVLFRLNYPCPLAPQQTQMLLDKIYLLKDAQGKGLGKWCMEWAEAYAQKHQQQSIWLTAMGFSSAYPFYEKLGYHTIHTTILEKQYMREPYRTMHYMEKHLNAVA